jgi:hypothetical protein
MADYLPPPPPTPPPPGDQSSGAQLPARGLGKILGEAWRIYTKNAGQLLLIVAVIVIPLSILGFLISHFAFAASTKVVTEAGQSVRVAEPRSFFIFLMAALVAAAISVIITALLQAALLRAAAEATIGDPVDVQTSYNWGLWRFGGVLLVSILVGLAVGIGFILLIIPGIIALVFFSVSVPALVVENVRGTEAMRRSWNLVRHHFWHVLGVILVAAILTGVIAGIIRAIGGSSAVGGAITSAVGQILVAPYSALVSVLLYLDLRARRENLTEATLRGELTSGD